MKLEKPGNNAMGEGSFVRSFDLSHSDGEDTVLAQLEAGRGRPVGGNHAGDLSPLFIESLVFE
jgi:hypothetical protein